MSEFIKEIKSTLKDYNSANKIGLHEPYFSNPNTSIHSG